MNLSFLRLDPRKAISHPSTPSREDTFTAGQGWIIVREGDTVSLTLAGVTMLVPWMSVLQARPADEDVMPNLVPLVKTSHNQRGRR